ncbi:hypothetical protein M0802_011285 [Mischocyttarus mexicanus]|nr:hypothetical protein M0802_011285 [Mischocyttarus mexicanus]
MKEKEKVEKKDRKWGYQRKKEDVIKKKGSILQMGQISPGNRKSVTGPELVSVGSTGKNTGHIALIRKKNKQGRGPRERDMMRRGKVSQMWK